MLLCSLIRNGQGGGVEQTVEVICFQTVLARTAQLACTPRDTAISVHRQLAVAVAGSVEVWGIDTNQTIQSLDAGKMKSQPFWSSNGALLALVPFLGEGVSLYDSNTWEKLAVIPTPGTQQCNLQWSPTGTSIMLLSHSNDANYLQAVDFLPRMAAP